MSHAWFATRKECPGCAAGRFRTLYESRYDEPPVRDYLESFYGAQGRFEPACVEGASYILCECGACGLIFQRDIPNAALMERVYEHWIDPARARAQHQAQNTLAYHAAHAQEILQVLAFLGRPPGTLRVFDFGLGWAEWAAMARAFGCDTSGTELSQERARHAGSLGIQVIAREDIPRQAFDFIHTEQVFEHLAAPLETLRHLKTGLKRDGLLKISVPNGHDIEGRLKTMDWKAAKSSKRSLNPVAPLEHINLFRRRSLVAMAAAAGLVEICLPASVQYRHMTDWGSLKAISRNLLQPLRRNVLRQANYILLRPSPVSGQAA